MSFSEGKAPLVFYPGSRNAQAMRGVSPSRFRIVGAEELSAIPDLIVLELSSDPSANSKLAKEYILRFRRPILAFVPRGDVQIALNAIREGVKEVLPEPASPAEIEEALSELATQPADGAQEEDDDQAVRTSLGQIIGSAPSMQRLYKRILSVSASDATAFIQGPSGTGKELVARAIHNFGRRAAMPFIAINCGAIAPNLLESELFGHEKGSFTGAAYRHEGKFEQADKGTLFLDEITELPLDLQVKLLRVIQEKSVSRVGGKEMIPVDARIICASNRDLKSLLARGLFREDLFYRLNVVPIHTPALSERRQDIPLLLNHFLAVFAEKYKKDFFDFSISAMTSLCAYAWPGNVREMENMVERIVVLNDGSVVDASFLPEEIFQSVAKASFERTAPPPVAAPRPETAPQPPSPPPPQQPWSQGLAPEPPGLQPMSFAAAEAQLIKTALAHTRGNAVQAAKILQIGQATLYRKFRKYAIDPKAFKGRAFPQPPPQSA